MTFFKFVVFRLFNILLSSTWFVPDEIFQSVEVSYELVFGKGYLSWEWDPAIAVRSAIHPSFYAVVLWALKSVNLDFNLLVNYAPNIMNAFLFAYADFCYLKFLKKLFWYKKKELRMQRLREIVLLVFIITGVIIFFAFKSVALGMALYLSNWFILYCATRSLSNTIETALTIIALNWYLFDATKDSPLKHSFKSSGKKLKDNLNMLCKMKSSEHNRPANTNKGIIFNADAVTLYCRVVFLASLAVLVRPTASLIWLPLCAIQFAESKIKWAYLLVAAFPCGMLAVGCGMWIDFLYYGSLKLTLWNFIKFNVLDGGSAEFGRNPWYWYINNGLPALLTISCLPLVTYFIKVFYVITSQKRMPTHLWTHQRNLIPIRFFWTSLFYIFAHSFIAHKEHRFLLPIIPLVIPTLLVEIESYAKFFQKYFKALILMVNIVLALYLGLVHQIGPNQAARVVLNDIVQANHSLTQAGDSQKVASFHILQLMPCFSMPNYARFHALPFKVTIRMLDCTPESAQQKTSMARKKEDGFVEDVGDDEDDYFYYSNNFTNMSKSGRLREDELFDKDALGWLRAHWYESEAKLENANVVVLFEHAYRRVKQFLYTKGFVVSRKVFHAHFLHSEDQDFRIVIVKKML